MASGTSLPPALHSMSKKTLQLPWICTRCLEKRASKIARRSLITSTRSNATVTTTISQNEPPVFKIDSSIKHDDRTLRQIFDSPSFWAEQSKKTTRQYEGRNAGLFQNRYLRQPEGFQQFTAITLSKCQRIVSAVLAYKSKAEYKRIARDLDRLSDLLCRVIDLSDFVRAVHPDRRFQLAAHQAYTQMFEYMNILNTTTGLDDQLKIAAATPEVWNSWSEEERTVATILMRDFAKSAIDMPQEKREAFVNISNEIAEVGAAFVDNIAPEQPHLSFPSSAMMGMDPIVARQLTKWGTLVLPLGGSAQSIAMRSVENPDIRRQIYTAQRTASRDNIHRLERLLKRRAELAKLAGYESYGHLTLSEKMAGSPEAVASFLDAVRRANAPRVKQEFAALAELKAQDARRNTEALEAWDQEYYSHRLLRSLQSKTRTFDTISAYFSLGTVMQGLSRMFHRLYGIRLVPQEASPGETWNSEVRRLDVIDDHEGRIAVIYCDLFERAGKSPNPAHFTLRCSRKISQEEIEESMALSAASGAVFDTPHEAANDGLATAPDQDGSHYQLPTIALICDFTVNPNKQKPALLSFREVRTLFHEMGHALHSICGRTQLQNVAGTRCATDFAELPSVLNESFASAPEVLALWARHWETDEPLNLARVEEIIHWEKRMEGAEIEAQILLGTLDQRYHSSLPLSWAEPDDNPSTLVYQDVWRQYSLIPEPAGTSWQGLFGHLFGYGATYYSYLFDRAVAGKIWKEVFQRTNALDPEAGHRYREEVLRWGGGRDGWKCVGGVLGGTEGEIIAQGGTEAMSRVGTWGVNDSWG